LDGITVKKVQKKKAGAGETASAKPTAIVLAGLRLFTQYGYRKTSIDDIAEAAQVAKRTVYLHFENKAAVFLAILEYLADQVRQRCDTAENAPGTPVDRLTGLLDAFFGMAFELFSKSEHMPELEEAFSKLARARIGKLNAEYEEHIARFFAIASENWRHRTASRRPECGADRTHLGAGGRGRQARPRDTGRSEGAGAASAGIGDTCHRRDEEVILIHRLDPVIRDGGTGSSRSSSL
jgi:AcrR family transcriptional regulator